MCGSCGWTSSTLVKAPAAGDTHAIAFPVASGKKPPGCEGTSGINYCSWATKASAYCCAGEKEGGLPTNYKGDAGVKRSIAPLATAGGEEAQATARR